MAGLGTPSAGAVCRAARVVFGPRRLARGGLFREIATLDLLLGTVVGVSLQVLIPPAENSLGRRNKRQLYHPFSLGAAIAERFITDSIVVDCRRRQQSIAHTLMCSLGLQLFAATALSS